MKQILVALSVLLIASCSGGGMSGGSKSDVYLGSAQSGQITGFSSSAIQIRQVELINAVRAENGAAPVVLNSQLTAAAVTHARDIANQNRAWNYGSDKSTPQDRAARAGYVGTATGEMVAETFLGEFDVFALWNSQNLARQAITNPRATDVGIAYFMDTTGKVWWVTLFGQNGVSPAN